MSRRHIEPTTRHHIILYDEDWELLSEVYGPDSESKIGPGAAVREIVRRKCREIRQRVVELRERRSGSAEA